MGYPLSLWNRSGKQALPVGSGVEPQAKTNLVHFGHQPTILVTGKSNNFMQKLIHAEANSGDISNCVQGWEQDL